MGFDLYLLGSTFIQAKKRYCWLYIAVLILYPL